MLQDMSTTRNKCSSLMFLPVAVLWLICFFVGVFCDHDLARIIYRRNDIAAVALSVIGLYAYYGSFVFFFGVLCRQLFNSAQRKISKLLICIIFTYMALSTSTYGAAAILSDSVCGLLLEKVEHSLKAYLTSGLYLYLPLFPLGILANGKRHDRTFSRKMILLLTVMTIAPFSSYLIKYLVMRPRYRIAVEGYEGIGFVPVYEHLKNGRELRSLYDLKIDDLASFYSGHAMNAALCMVIFPFYAYVFRFLKGREKHLSVFAFIISVPIVISRMVLGDHYLSDISFGSIIGLMFCVVFRFLSLRVPTKDD